MAGSMWKLELVRSLTQTSFSRRSIAAARVHEGRGGHQQRLCQIAVHLPCPAFRRTTASLEDRTCSVCCDSGTRPRAYGRQQRRSGDSSGTLRLRLMLLTMISRVFVRLSYRWLTLWTVLLCMPSMSMPFVREEKRCICSAGQYV